MMQAARAERQVGQVDMQPHRRMKVELKGASLALVNAVRRSMLTEVPTIAIDSVAISRNDSTTLDAEIAHRLGLMPLKYAAESPFGRAGDGVGIASWIERDACSSDLNIAAQRVSASLRVEAVRERRVVRASDVIFEPPCVLPVRPDSVVALLRPGEGLRLEGTLLWGIGRWHSKWNPTVAAAARRAAPIALEPCGVCGDPSCGCCGGDRTAGSDIEQTEHVLEFSTTGAVTPPEALLRALAALRGKLGAFARAFEANQAMRLYSATPPSTLPPATS